MGKTGSLFKKIGDIKGTFHARNGTIKDRNGKVITEAEEIKKRWRKYIEEPYKKALMTQMATNDPDNHSSMITHLELNILECEVKWAYGKHYCEQS